MVNIKSKEGRRYQVMAINENECIIYDVTNPFKKKVVTVYAGSENEMEDNIKDIEKYEKRLKQ